MKKIYNILFAISFIIVLILPMLRQFSTDNSKSLENRKLVSFPSIPKTLIDSENYPQKVGKFLSDNFGFRTSLINLSNQIYYHVFNELTSSKITFGKNGFVFLGSHEFNKKNSLIKRVCDIDKLNKNSQEYIGKIYTKVIDHFNQLGYITSIAVIPTKSRIYSENLPKTVSNWCSKNNPTSIDNAINSIDNKFIYYPLSKFRKWKNEFQVYLPSFFHWHGKLPFIVSKDIMKTLWNIEPNLTVKEKSIIVKSDLRAFLMGLKFIDKSVKYNFSDNGVNECRNKQCILPLKSDYRKGMNVFQFKKKQTINDKRLVLFTDSFGLNIAQNFILGFDEVTLFRLIDPKLDENPDFIKSVLKSQKPTHILFLYHDAGVIAKAHRFNRLMNKYNK